MLRLQSRCRRSELGEHGSGRTASGSLIIVAFALSAFASCSSGENGDERSLAGRGGGAIKVEEARVDFGDGVVVQTRIVGPVDAADTLITIHGGPGLSLEAMSGVRTTGGARTTCREL